MKKDKNDIYGFTMARIAEVYLSTLSLLMKPHGIERYFKPLQYLVANSGKLTQKDLADVFGRDKVSIMRTVDYLCDKGLLMRKPDANDRRCHLLEVTQKAIDLQPLVDQAVQQTNEILLQNFSSEDKKQFKIYMNKIYQTIHELPESEFIVEAYKRNK